MSAQEELPPGCRIMQVTIDDPPQSWAAILLGGNMFADTKEEVIAKAWALWERRVGITREELATMRAAVERCAELEAALEAALVMVKRAYEIGFGGTYGLDGSPYALAREIEKSGLLSDTPTGGE